MPLLCAEDTRFDTAPAPAQSPPKLVVGLSDSRTAAANPPSVAEGKSDKSLNLPQASQGPQGLPIQKPCVMGHMPGVQSMGSTPNLRLGSSAAAASFIAMRAKSAAAAAARAPAPPARSSDGSKPALKAVSKAHHVRGKGSAVLLPLAPSIDNVRQVLAHANRLLDAAAAEPQWLRGSARRFERGAWADVITKSQVLAMRCVEGYHIQSVGCCLIRRFCKHWMQSWQWTADGGVGCLNYRTWVDADVATCTRQHASRKLWLLLRAVTGAV